MDVGIVVVSWRVETAVPSSRHDSHISICSQPLSLSLYAHVGQLISARRRTHGHCRGRWWDTEPRIRRSVLKQGSRVVDIVVLVVAVERPLGSDGRARGVSTDRRGRRMMRQQRRRGSKPVIRDPIARLVRDVGIEPGSRRWAERLGLRMRHAGLMVAHVRATESGW